jgi:DNA-directed RNA polymerase II subunit RPB2
MKFYNDTWEVIDNYFSTTPYFLTKHHLDSYNDFVSNKILATIKVLNNAFVVLKNENNGATQNEINVYIGGLEGNEVFINKPTVVENGEARLLYPNEARLRDLTYQSELFANIHIVIRSSTIGQPEKIIEKVFKNVKIGAVPIMLHSKLCVLHNQPPDVLREMGECPYDQGGYFVVDGKEKVIVAQERIATNRIFISKSKDIKYSYEGLIRCTSIENPLFPKTTYLYMNDVRPNSEMIDNAISIAIPNVMKPIPIYILFRALGIESDKQIMEYIMYDIDDPINTRMLEFLRYSVLDNHEVYSQEDAMAYIAKYVEYNSLDRLKYTLVNDLFPNVGHNFKNKAMFLGHIVSKLVRVALGVMQETDRDNYQYKRVDISGFLLANLFRDYYNQFRNVVRNNIDRAYLYGPWKTSGLENLINKGNMNTIFQPHIIEDGMRKSLKGSWGKLMIKEDFKAEDLENIKQEIVQDLNRFSYAGTISHLRRCNTPLDPTAVKMVGPHKLHTSQWGIMCPAESPDGASIGLLKNFAILANVTFDVPVEHLIKCLEKLGMKYTEDVLTTDVSKMTKILVNSNWIGVCANPMQMFHTLKLMKRNALINIYTSISWDIFNSEINVLTESGRCCRPVYVVGKNNTLIIDKHFQSIKKKQVNWVDLIKGDLIPTEKFSHTFDGFIDPFKLYESKNGKKAKDLDDIIEFLEKTQAPIEYTDVEETNGHLIAMDGEALTKDNKQYTHCEIHASTMLSAIGVNTPYSDHNQAPRNIFSTGQCKQSVGMYATNFNNRIDTMTYVMNYPHRPITATRYSEYTNFNTMTHGQNLIVAVATYTGYNQEDSIIFNKTSVERGMFNLTYYKNMVDAEEENKKNNEAIRFANPLRLLEEGKNLADLKFANYKKLDDNGFPKVGSYIHEGDAIVGKCKIKTEFIEDEATKNNIFNNKIKREVYEDKSVVADKTVSGIIDRVFVYFDDHNNKKVKIRFRKNRAADIGDKNCCYDKMTEVLTDQGWVLFKDLTMEHSVASLVNDKLVYQKPSALQEFDFDGHLYKVDSGQVKLLVTDNHRMYVRQYSRNTRKPFGILEAQDCNGKILYYKKNVDEFIPEDPSNNACFIVNDNNEITHFVVENEKGRLEFDINHWLTVFGIYMAEGSIGGKNTVNIAAHKARVKRALEVSVPSIGLKIGKKQNKRDDEPNNWCIYNVILTEYLKQFGTATKKFLPEWVWFLSREQCQQLIASMCLGDGHVSTSGTQQYDTSSNKLADDFQRLCLHAGWSCNKHLKMLEGTSVTGNDGHVYKATANNWRMSIVKKQNEPIVNGAKWKHIQDGWEQYTGKVYCCTVPEGDGVVYVRREGRPVWSGNSRAGQLIG